MTKFWERHKHEFINAAKPMRVSGYGYSQYKLLFCKCGYVECSMEFKPNGDKVEGKK